MEVQDGNWPIRIGGVYEANGAADLFRQVVRIENEIVYYRVGDMHDGKLSFSSWVTTADEHMFREMSLREDQSPLPELYALLERCRKHLAGATDQEDWTVLVEAIDAALAAQGVR